MDSDSAIQALESAKKALNKTNSYPTFKTLYDEYHNHNLTVDERKNLLSGIIKGIKE